jgi:hypothetical protein
MTGWLSFGVYCQVAEYVQPQNSLAPWTQAAILVGSLRNLSSGQVFLAFDTSYTITGHQWVALQMLPAVIYCLNLLGRCEHAMLTFTNQQGHDISDSKPQDANFVGNLDDNSIIIHPAVEIPGVDTTTDPVEIAEVNPDFDVKPTGVDMDADAWAMDTDVPVDNNAIAIIRSVKQDDSYGASNIILPCPGS